MVQIRSGVSREDVGETAKQKTARQQQGPECKSWTAAGKRRGLDELVWEPVGREAICDIPMYKKNKLEKKSGGEEDGGGRHDKDD